MDVKEIGVLTLERRKHEDIIIGDDIRIRVIQIDRNRVKLAVIAPKSIPVSREGGRGEPKPDS